MAQLCSKLSVLSGSGMEEKDNALAGQKPEKKNPVIIKSNPFLGL
jgi:hypothetical protein